MKTMILDNDIDNIKTYDSSGVDRIFIDLEVVGKAERQGGLDTVISNHTVDDVKRIKPVLKNSELIVRVNPIHANSAFEISNVINNGADIVMLPMFKTVEEVSTFVKYVDNKAKVCLLLETTEALCRIDDILEVNGIDEVHVGLNDLHIAMGLDFMFELLGSDLIEFLTNKIRLKSIPFGIGGVARMGDGMLNGKIVMLEHVRLGSTMVILSRTFKGKDKPRGDELKTEIIKLQSVVKEAQLMTNIELVENKKHLKSISNKIASKLAAGKDHEYMLSS